MLLFFSYAFRPSLLILLVNEMANVHAKAQVHIPAQMLLDSDA